MKLFKITHKNVLLYASGQAISIIGDSAEAIALSWWVLEKTGSAGDVAKITVPGLVLRLFLTPLIAPIADKFSPKRTLLLSNFLKFLVFIAVALLTLTDQFHWFALMSLYMLASVFGAIFSAAAGGYVPSLVDREEIPEAMQKTSLLQTIGGISGGMLGAIAVSAVGNFGAMFFNALSFLVSLLLILMIDKPDKLIESKYTNLSTSYISWRIDLYQGFRFIFKLPGLASSLFVFCAVNFFASGLNILLPTIVNSEKIDVKYLGIIESVGMTGQVGALFAISFLGSAKFSKSILCAVFLLLTGTSIFFFSLVHTPLVPALAMFIAMGSCSLFNMMLSAQLMMIIPENYRGRVGAFMGTMCGAAVPLGFTCASVFSDKFSPSSAISVSAVGVVSLAVVLFFHSGFSKLMNCTADNADKLLDN